MKNVCVVQSLALLMFASVACVSTPPRQSPLGASPLAIADGERIIANQAVIVFDGSHSIDSASSFPPAKALLESFVEGMPEGTYDAAGIELGQIVFAFQPVGISSI